ncbi:tRNA selenocysteine 1-associated protein 1-like protein [Leptotrombidium deliense]|uniref:tRNA selenocysteine-associated protein 1 n=1 Tax=Leptotrombidium deliense TaxID=299467 RepID=A0A443SCB4_9ACAR|nr:tRNA selenocysteine 1-associated protein 1-like protein [Leptotrombidium deliense]
MDEKFIREAFSLLGEQVINVKIIKSRIDGSPVGYGFVSFIDGETAKRILCQLNRKQIPNAPQGKRFKLNTVGRNDSQKTHTIFVGDLPEEIDDITLFTAFSVRYASTKTAKVILNTDGKSKCFGFVKFGEECDYEAALRECPRTVTFGLKPIRVSVAIPKNKAIQRQIQTIGSSNIVLTQANEANNDSNDCWDNSSETSQYNSSHQYLDYNSFYQNNNFAAEYYSVPPYYAYMGNNNVADQCGFSKPYRFDYNSSTNATISAFESFLTSIHDSKWF